MADTATESSKKTESRSFPFASHIAAVKEKIAQITESRKMAADLLFMTTYMDSLAIANATRPEIFSYAAKRSEYISAKYIARVDTFVKKWNYSYAEGLSIVAERTSNETLKSMLNRYANSIQAGVPDDDFLSSELLTIRSLYRSQQEQGLSMLEKWGDAYIAMLLAGTVIAVTIMISVVIYSMGNLQATLNLAYAIILVICIFGIFLMYTSAPYDPKTHDLAGRRSKEQETIHSMERIILPVAALAVIAMALLGISAGLIFILVGILMAPMGIIGFIDDKNIIQRDDEFSTFIKNFGAVMGGKSTTPAIALGSIDRKSLNALDPLINSVYSKLNLGLDEKQTWDKFIGETGSHLISKYLNIFRDTVALGGPPQPIGAVISSSMLEQTLQRQKKDMQARSFLFLLVPMHITMTGIFVVLYEILHTLTGSVSTMMAQFSQNATSSGGMGGADISQVLSGGMGMFTNFPTQTMNTFVVITIAILTISNITAIRIVGGGGRYMYYFYAAIFFALTGIVLIIAPIVVGFFFNPAALTGMGTAAGV